MMHNNEPPSSSPLPHDNLAARASEVMVFTTGGDQMETKDFKLSAILGLTTGISLGPFGELHELAEFVTGHPIWTHEFAERSLWVKLQQWVLAQHPALPTSGATRENWKEWLTQQEARFGYMLPIRKGIEQRTESPAESLRRIAPDKPVLFVDPKKGSGRDAKP